MRREKRTVWLWIGLAVGCIWLAAVSRWIVGDTVVPWDSKNQFYAFFRFLASSLHSGSMPFWNPYHYGGHPAVADPQSLIFSPFFVLWAMFDPAPSMRAFDLIVHAHLLAGGLATAAIGRRAGWPAAACVLAAAVFMFGGAAAARLQHTGAIITYALFPPTLLCMQIALQRVSYLSAILAGFFGALLLLGRNQVALLFGFLLIAMAIAEIAVAPRPSDYLRGRLPVLAVMGLTCAAIAGAPLLLTLQFAALSNRPAVLLEQAFEASLYPVNLATLAVPNVFGSNILPSHAWPYPYWGPNHDTVPEVGATDPSFNYMFVGLVPVVLFLWLGLAGGLAWQRGRRLILAGLVAALIYMLGRYTPLFALAFEWVPGVAIFRRPVDANFVFIAALALLAGFLLADYIRDGLPKLRTLPLAIVVIATGLILGWSVAFSARSGQAWTAFIEVAKALALAGVCIAALAMARTVRARQWVGAMATLFAVAELLWWNAASRLNAEEHKHYAVLEQPAASDATTVALIKRIMTERQAEGARPRVEIVGLGGPWQNLAIVHGIEATNGYNPLRIGFYDRMVAPGETTYLTEQRTFPKTFDGYDCALARALGLEYLVLGKPIEQIPKLARRPVAELLMAGPHVWVYRLKGTMPRVAFAGRVQVADAGATDWLGQPLADPSPDRVLIDDDTPPTRAYAPAFAGKGDAKIVVWRPDRVEIAVDSLQGGVLALHDTYYPGWVAEIDGRRAPILRADVLFRAVEVPPGARRVVFRYAPFSSENLVHALRVALRRIRPDS